MDTAEVTDCGVDGLGVKQMATQILLGVDTPAVTQMGIWTLLGSHTLNTHYHSLGCGDCWWHALGGWALPGLHTGMGTLLASHTGVCPFMMSHRTRTE